MNRARCSRLSWPGLSRPSTSCRAAKAWMRGTRPGMTVFELAGGVAGAGSVSNRGAPAPDSLLSIVVAAPIKQEADPAGTADRARERRAGSGRLPRENSPCIPTCSSSSMVHGGRRRAARRLSVLNPATGRADRHRRACRKGRPRCRARRRRRRASRPGARCRPMTATVCMRKAADILRGRAGRDRHA